MIDPLQVSVVIPVFNEEPVLREFYPRLKKEAESWGKSYELLFVDDGSTDRSFDLICKWKKTDSTLRVVKFTRNFGQQAAVLAGFHYCRGDIVVQIDSDLQNPPEEINRLLNAFTDEVDLVVTIPRKRRDSSLRIIGSKALHCFAKAFFLPHFIYFPRMFKRSHGFAHFADGNVLQLTYSLSGYFEAQTDFFKRLGFFSL